MSLISSNLNPIKDCAIELWSGNKTCFSKTIGKLSGRRLALAAVVGIGVISITMVVYRSLQGLTFKQGFTRRIPLTSLEIPPNAEYDIVHIGAGPTGLANACLIKALDPKKQICVLDKRAETTRDFGLVLTKDSMDKILSLLKSIPQPDKNVQELQKTYQTWRKRGVVRTSDIENTLTKIAEQMKIPVLRGPQYGITDTVDENKVVLETAKDKMSRLISNKPQSEAEHHLCNIFKNAKVIVGVDGARSTVREFIGATKTDQSNLNWVIQLKYQTKGWVQPSYKIQKTSVLSTEEHIVIEQISRQTGETYKPATVQIFVDEETCEAFVNRNQKGEIEKGDSARPWTILEIEQRALSDAHAKTYRVYEMMVRQLGRAERHYGVPKEAKVSILPIGLYRSTTAWTEKEGKIFVTAGDAYAGLALRRGANNGQKAAAMLAQTVIDYLNHKNEDAFEKYNRNLEAMTKNEMKWIKRRASALSFLDTMLIPVRPVGRAIGWLLHTRRPVPSNAGDWSRTLTPEEKVAAGLQTNPSAAVSD